MSQKCNIKNVFLNQLILNPLFNIQSESVLAFLAEHAITRGICFYLTLTEEKQNIFTLSSDSTLNTISYPPLCLMLIRSKKFDCFCFSELMWKLSKRMGLWLIISQSTVKCKKVMQS